jgi:hypothetical protein
VSIILEDAAGRALKVNAWNWGVLHHLVAAGEVLAEDIWAPKRNNGGGALEADQCAALARFLESVVLPCIGPGERMFYDGSVTREPDDGTFYREESEQWRNYSLHREVLERLIDFLRVSKPPVAFL